MSELHKWLDNTGQTYEEFQEVRDANDLLSRINGKITKVKDG